MKLYCYHINSYMPKEIINMGNNAFNIFKNNYSISSHCEKRMKERGICIGNINDYKVCEVYLKGKQLETIGVYKKHKDSVTVLYISGYNPTVKTAVILNKYSFQNVSRKIRYSTELPSWMIKEFELKSDKNNSKNIYQLRRELADVNNLIDSNFEKLMINYEDDNQDRITELHNLWIIKKELREQIKMIKKKEGIICQE